MLTRRDFLKTTAAGSAVVYFNVLGGWGRAFAVPLAAGLSDPELQPKFINAVPNALDPAFKYHLIGNGRYSVSVRSGRHYTGLVDPKNGRALVTPIFGYGDDRGPTWPGRTFEIDAGPDPVQVRWSNDLRGKKHLLPVDTSLHWAYSLEGYQQYSIQGNGIPIITHLHGGHSAFQFDGNPEFFYSPDGEVVGPQWQHVEGGYTNLFGYDVDVPAGTLWYHDHALGITRLNVYAGMAGFFIVRDNVDTGLPGNEHGLPAHPYELAFAIQDRMFTDRGDLFYPAFPGDPFYDDFITGEGAVLPPSLFPGGGPTALAEFFGDHMMVNGVAWPLQTVEPRHYRLRLLNGSDSRFLVIQFREAAGDNQEQLEVVGAPLTFDVIGSDQGLGSPTTVEKLVIEPGGRYDLVVDFKGLQGQRIIMTNIGGDAPFGGAFGDDLEPEDVFPARQTDRIMAFDVADISDVADDYTDGWTVYGGNVDLTPPTTRRVALFEGVDEFGRLQPLLGIEDDVYDGEDLISEWRAIAWHSPTTELPALGTTEEWEIHNFTGDAHPIHLHLVNFEVLGRSEIDFDTDDGDPGQPVPQHNGEVGWAPNILDVSVGDPVVLGGSDGYVENAPKDVVTALPEQVTRIKTNFDKPGRYVWHCHILSHEDHEMMRVLQVIS